MKKNRGENGWDAVLVGAVQPVRHGEGSRSRVQHAVEEENMEELYKAKTNMSDPLFLLRRACFKVSSGVKC